MSAPAWRKRGDQEVGPGAGHAAEHAGAIGALISAATMPVAMPATTT